MTLDQIKPALGRSIDDLSPSTPLIEAATRAAGGRLAAVLGLTPHVIEHGRDEARPVHRLRVATRRADAALRLFTGELPPKRLTRVRRSLKQIRRSATPVRAADVHAADLLARLDANPAPAPGLASALAFAAGLTLADRDAAFDRLASSLANETRDRLAHAGDRLLRSTRRRTSTRDTFGPVARDAVAAQVRRADDAARDDLTDPARLHQLRIELKRLRYTIEAIGDVADAIGVDRLYERLLDAQDRFGAVNDAVELAARLDDARRRAASAPCGAPPAVLDALAGAADEARTRADSAHRALLGWWPASDLATALNDADLALSRGAP